MRRYHLIPLMLAGALAYTAACSDAAAPKQSPSTGNPTPPPPPPPSTDYIWLSPSNFGVLLDDTFSIHGYVVRQGGLVPDTLDWQISDSTIASVEAVEANRLVIHAIRPGSMEISARTRGPLPLTQRVSLTVWGRSSQPAPVEVVDFHALEYVTPFSPAEWAYTPQLSLRAVGQDSVRILGVTMDLPGTASPVYCSSAGVLGQATSPMFAPLGYENSIIVTQEDHRTRQGPQAVARITVLLNDGTAAQLVALGPIIGGQAASDAFSHRYESAEGAFMSCG